MKYIKTKNNNLYQIIKIDHKQEFVKCFPLGGGFVYNIKYKDVIQWNAKPSTTWVKTFVGFDDHLKISAYIKKDDFWNGWLNPYLTLHGLRMWKKYNDHFIKQGDACPKIIIHQNGTFSMNDYYDPNSNMNAIPENDGEWSLNIKPVKIVINNKLKTLYCVGFGFCWINKNKKG